MNTKVEKLIEAAVLYGEALEKGNPKVANKQSEIIQQIRKDILNSKEFDVQELIPLLSHSNDYVKLVVACSMIKAFPDVAEQSLRELSSKRGLSGFEAKMTLQEWEVCKERLG